MMTLATLCGLMKRLRLQLERHKHYCCRKQGAAPKHPLKVHVWGGINTNGRTELVIFEGTMDASLYVEILKVGLLPFLRQVYPDGHRFMQDNDPKHTLAAAKEFFAENSINWWKTPPESPDANLWHELICSLVSFPGLCSLVPRPHLASYPGHVAWVRG